MGRDRASQLLGPTREGTPLCGGKPASGHAGHLDGVEAVPARLPGVVIE